MPVRSSSACAAGTPRARRSTPISSSRRLTRISRTRRSRIGGIRARGGLDSRLTAAHAIDDLEQNQSADFLDTKRNTVDWQNDFAVSENQTSRAGLLWQDEKANAESFGLPYAADTTTTQVYVQDQAASGPHRLLLGAAYTDHETFGGHATGNVEYGFVFAGGALVAASAGTGFRAPDATDLYGFGGNPDLDAEESLSFELRYRQPFGERHSVSLAAFRNDIDQLIEFVVIDPDTFEGENRNVAKARIDGIEAGWQFDGERWAASATATLQDPRDRTTDARLLRRARENFTAAVLRRIGNHEIELDLLYAGERRDFGFPEQTQLPAYWLANVSAKLAFGDRFTCWRGWRTCSTRTTNWRADSIPWARASSRHYATSSAEAFAWETGSRRSIRARAMTARPASATAAAYPKTIRASRPMAASTRRTAQLA